MKMYNDFINPFFWISVWAVILFEFADAFAIILLVGIMLLIFYSIALRNKGENDKKGWGGH